MLSRKGLEKRMALVSVTGKNPVVFTLRTRSRSYDLEASVRQIGEDFVVSIWGGDVPHVGAVALAQPRPSLKDPETVSATASVFCVVGHKEDGMVKTVSEILAAALNARVVVTAGIHWDNLSAEGISHVLKNGDVLVKQILKKIKQLRRTGNPEKRRRRNTKG